MSEGSTNGIVTRRYEIPSDKPGEGWGIFLIDDRGFFAVVSDWGNYAYMWTAPGQEFRKFLCQLNADYLCIKLAPQLVYDGEKTEQRIRRHILRCRRERRIDRETARREIDRLESLALYQHQCEYGRWLEQSELEDAFSVMSCFVRDPQTMQFCKRLYPRFVEVLRAELAQETDHG